MTLPTMRSPLRLRIDHVTLAGRDLAAMRERFAALGLATDYGGPHENGITHMALLGFDDGSYLELISSLRPGTPAPLWNPQIAGDAGPAAWCVRGADLAAEAGRLAAAGVASRGPIPMARHRPDGTRLTWDLLFPGADPPGATLPFAIADRTARGLRVAPSASVAGSELSGVGQVVIGVHSLTEASERFQRAFGWPAPLRADSSALGARVARFAETPVVLAEPAAGGAWLRERLERFGESPCAYLLDSRGFTRTAARLPLVGGTAWFGRTTAWIDPARLGGWRLGIVAA